MTYYSGITGEGARALRYISHIMTYYSGITGGSVLARVLKLGLVLIVIEV